MVGFAIALPTLHLTLSLFCRVKILCDRYLVLFRDTCWLLVKNTTQSVKEGIPKLNAKGFS